MKHLPKVEYTEADQRSDTSFLVGSRFGKETERARILAVLNSAGIEVSEDVMARINTVYPKAWSPSSEATTQAANERARRWEARCMDARAEVQDLQAQLDDINRQTT
jgi:hypothetical protein